jgi:hypothetical protein
MNTNEETDLTDLTENQKGVLKVLADADGEALRGVEVRRRLREDYGIELTKNGMNSVTSRDSRYPRKMVDIGWVDSSEIEGNTRHAYHRLKSEYIDKVRNQLQ